MKEYPFIDMHTHLFNSHYLPLDGIFRSWHIPLFISRPLTHIVTAITEESDFSGAESESEVFSISDALLKNDDELFDYVFQLIIDKLAEKLFSKVRTVQEIEESKFISALNVIANDYYDDVLGTFDIGELSGRPDLSRLWGNREALRVTLMSESKIKMLEHALFAFFEDAENYLDCDYLREQSERYFKDIETFRGKRFSKPAVFLRFVVTLLASERSIYESLLQDYKSDVAEYKVPEKILNVMQDMERGYDRYTFMIPPVYEFKNKQIPRMDKLTKENGSKIVTFAAISPRRCNWKDYMHAAMDKGIKGFKIYPPMGFRAANKGNYVPSIDQKELPKKKWPKPQSDPMNRRMGEILDKCVKLKLCIFTHCTPTGFEAKKGWGLNADPTYWEQAIKEKESRRDIILCLGHAGGTRIRDWYGWAAESETKWEITYAHKVIELCRQYENIYCDVGYWLELLGDRETQAYKNIVRRFKASIISNEGPYLFRKKVMYGSDWHMKSIINRTREYLNIFYRIFDDESMKPYAEDFFTGNALRFLSLPNNK